MDVTDETMTSPAGAGDGAAGAAQTPDPVPSSSTTDTPVSAGDTAAEVWREMQQTSDPSGSPPDTPPDPSHAQPARQADGSQEAPGSLPTRGPIPYDRHQAVLTTTRAKVREEVEREYREKFGWAESYQPDQVQTGQRMLAWLQRDPAGFVQFVQGQIEGASASSAATADPEPEPDIPLEDGRAVYSAERLREWQAWHGRQIRREIDATYGPIAHRVRLQEMTVSAQHEAGTKLADCRANWPFFRELESDIKQRMTANERLTLHDAYIASMREVGLARQRTQWEAERSGQLTRKAAASTVQPGAPRPSTPRPDAELSTRDIVRQEWARHAAS